MTKIWVLTIKCVDKPGIVNAVSGALVAAGGNIEASQQFASPDTGKFFMRIEVSASADQTDFCSRFIELLQPVIRKFQMQTSFNKKSHKLRTLVLASKAMHCVNDLLYRQQSGQLNIDIPVILANHDIAADLASFYGIDFEHIPIHEPADKQKFEQRIREIIADHSIELVVLARYMQILSPELCAELAGKAINIHHSFLPGFKGANPYRQAHTRGVKLIGATAHFVTDDLDEGPIIEQEVVRVSHNETVQQLQTLGQDVEARALRQAVSWFAGDRILLDDTRTVVFK